MYCEKLGFCVNACSNITGVFSSFWLIVAKFIDGNDHEKRVELVKSEL